MTHQHEASPDRTEHLPWTHCITPTECAPLITSGNVLTATSSCAKPATVAQSGTASATRTARTMALGRSLHYEIYMPSGRKRLSFFFPQTGRLELGNARFPE